MRHLFIFLTAILVQVTFAQSEVFKNIESKFENNNIKSVATNFNNSLKVRILDDEGMYAKNQAETVISNFVKQHPISSFQLLHQGTNKEGGLHYAIYKYSSGSQSFRTYILLKQNGGSYLIDTISFNNE